MFEVIPIMYYNYWLGRSQHFLSQINRENMLTDSTLKIYFNYFGWMVDLYYGTWIIFKIN